MPAKLNRKEGIPTPVEILAILLNIKVKIIDVKSG